MATRIRFALGVITAILAVLFLISATLNLGLKIPVGAAVMSFVSPSPTIAAFEILIGILLVAGAGLPNMYLYGGAYTLAIVGISEGLLSSDVQGFARELHEFMVPFAALGLIAFASEARATYREKKYQTTDQRKRDVVLTLQFFVGALVTLGGAAFAEGGTYPIGTTFGLVHLGVGIAGLYGGYAFLKRKGWSLKFLVAINGVIIVYSLLAETFAQVYGFLEPGINDALVGTVIAIIVSGIIVCLVRSLLKTSQLQNHPAIVRPT
jgi:hypothetical protein